MKKRYKILLTLIIIFLLLFLLAKSLVVREVLSIIFTSFIISYSLKPMHKKLLEKGLNRRLAAVILISTIVVIFLIIFFVLIPSLFKETLSVSAAVNKIQDIVNGFYKRVNTLNENKMMYAILTNVYEKTDKIVLDLSNKFFQGVISFGENLFSLAVVPIIVYYFLSDGDKITNKFLVFFPTSLRTIVKKIIKDIDKILGRYIISQFMLCALIGILTFIVLIILKVDFPLMLSIINAIFNIIPYFGPIFGALPAVFIALLSSTKTAIYTAILLYLIQQIEGDILSPKITGDSVSMHPLLVIILLVLGGKIGGFLGMILAIPIGVVIKVIYEDIDYYLF